MSADPVRDRILRMAAAVAERKATGAPYQQIARKYGVSMGALHRHCDPSFRERSNALRSDRRRRIREAERKSGAVVDCEYEHITKHREVVALLGGKSVMRTIPISLPRVRWLERSL